MLKYLVNSPDEVWFSLGVGTVSRDQANSTVAAHSAVMPSIVKYDDRPSGKSLPARPTLLESLPEAVGFNRVRWASVNVILFLIPLLAEVGICSLLGSRLGVYDHKSPLELVYFLAYCWASSGSTLLFIESSSLKPSSSSFTVFILGLTGGSLSVPVTESTTISAIYQHIRTLQRLPSTPGTGGYYMYFTYARGHISWSDTVASLKIGPMSHLHLRVAVLGGANQEEEEEEEELPYAPTASTSANSSGSHRYCDVCNRNLNLGKGGDANWNIHLSSKEHRGKVKIAQELGKTPLISSFFAAQPPRIPLAHAPPIASTSRSNNTASTTSKFDSGPVSDSTNATPTATIIHIDVAPDEHATYFDSDIPPHPMDLDTRTILLRRLQITVSTLPVTVPLGCNTDLLAAFCVDPVTLVGREKDAIASAWEDVIHDILDTLTWSKDERRYRTSIELSHLIKRGELGMMAFSTWVEKCFFGLNIDAGMMESRLERVIQAMILLGATTTVEPLIPLDHPMPQPPAKSVVKSKPTPLLAGCPGQELPLKDGKASFLSYPLAIHSERQLPWGVEFGPRLIIRSYECKRRAQKSGVCYECNKLLRHGIVKGIIERNATGTHPNTPFAYLTADDAQFLLRKKNDQINALKLSGLMLAQTLLVRATHLAAHSRLQIAVGRGDVPRIHSIVANCMKNGDSIFTCVEKILRASNSNFSDKSYTRAENQQAYLLWKVGGQACAELGHRCFGLPSVSTVRRHIGTKPLTVSPGAPTMREMHENLDAAFPIPCPLPSDGSIGPGFQIMVDEIKVEGRMRWDPRSNMILGLCREHTRDFDLEFRGIEQAEALHAGIAANTVHLASEATVVAVSSFSDIPVRTIAHPFVVAPTCKREAAKEQEKLLRAACEAVIAKAGRIGATLMFTFIRELDRNGDLFKKLGDLPLFDYHCGLDDLTGNIDLKHLYKRFRNTLIRLLACTIDDVLLTRELIKQHLVRDSRHNAQHIDKLLNPNDRQDVKLMYDLLSAIAVLPEARDTDTPAFKNTRRILRLLGAFYRHILEAYTNINLSLHQQLVHLSAAMHLMMAIYKKEAGRFIPSQTYFDFMTAGKNIFFCVAKTQLDDPNGKFWIIQPGSDPLEGEFGRVRTMTGGDSNTDMAQLGNRLTAAVECDNIFAEHPEWSRDPRRLRLPVWQDVAGDVSAKIDHISARSWMGDVSVSKVSNKTAWMGGRQIAEGELLAARWEPPFKSMEQTGGFSIFCPFGKNKMVLLDPPEPDSGERNEDPDEGDVDEPIEMSATIPSDIPAATDSDRPFLPDVEDMAREAVVSLTPAKETHEAYLPITGSTIKQHKATILRIFSSRFSIAESRDRLKRVRGFSRHNDSTLNTSANSNDTIPGEPMVEVEDPAAILVRSNDFTWLAVVVISGITCGTKHVETLPKRLLGEPNVRAKVQIMELVPAHTPPRDGSDGGEWEWSGKFITSTGTSKFTEVDGSLLQLLDPAVLPASNPSQKGISTYHFKSLELVAIAASMELATRSMRKLPEIVFSATFPYRTSSESFCSIVLVKRRGGDGATRIDLTKSRCPNLANLGLATAAKSSDRSPCTNRSLPCPISPCPDVVWKYNLEYHIRTVHPTANFSNYESHYALADGEELALKTFSTQKKRKSSKKAVKFRISEEHSTEAALGQFSRILPDAERAPSRSPSPDVEDHFETSSVRSLSPLEDDDDEMPSPRALLEVHTPRRADLVERPASSNVTPISEAHLNQPTQHSEMVLTTHEPSDIQIAPQVYPKPRRIVKNTHAPLASASPVDEPMSAPIVEPTSGESEPTVRRSRRVPVPRKRCVVLSEDEEEEEEEEEQESGCTAPGCTTTDDVPFIACSGPACDSRVCGFQFLTFNFLRSLT
ncbi:hypothetical protein B0H10DRAFT_2379639 [Mycena sp. CBHHK59/15]|nr:hypothetical protein B0H10DRAFT_2379639 [Mycena sp. CBHHK59/15]